MKRFIVKLAIFLTLLCVVDFAIGKVCRYLQVNSKGGNFGRNTYIHERMLDEIVLLGSSRCIHHYDATLISDSLGMSCYNCGTDGNGIILMYPRYKLITARYKPKVILYELSLGFDITANEDNHTYLRWIRSYHNHKPVEDVILSVDPIEKFKMLSQSYCFNSEFFQLLLDNIHPINNGERGYRPLEGIMNHNLEVSNKPVEFSVDSLKLHYMKALINECKENNIQLVFALSPSYKKEYDGDYQLLFDLAEENGVPVLNHFCDTNFVNKKEFFVDRTHMNKYGANKYSEVISEELKEYLKKKNW